MDHDSVPFDAPRPASHKSGDIRDAYAVITRHGLEAMGERIEHDSAYQSNEDGHFAWDMSLLVRAACLTWRVTGDLVHLQQAVTWARHMVERTDERLGLADWRGLSGPVWSAGSRYTARTTTVGTINGAPIRIQAAADRVIVERPSETSVIIHAIREGDRTWSTPEVSLLPQSDNYLPDFLGGRSTVLALQVRGLSAPMDLTSIMPGEYVMEPQFATHFVHTGMIARSLICAAETLESAERDYSSASVTPNELLTVAKQALLFHDEEIRTRSGQFWYITPGTFPGRRTGLDLPHNHIVDAATAFLILGRRNADEGLWALGCSLTRRFLGEIEAYKSGVIPHPWFYYPVDSPVFSGVTREEPIAERRIPPVPRGEDSSHATMRVRALTEWKAIEGRLVPDNLLSTVALSFRRHYMCNRNGIATLRWLPGDTKDSPRNSLTDAYAGAWGWLAPWDSTIKRRINAIAYRNPPTSIFGATVLSSAEILAMNAGVLTYASSDRTSRA